MSVRLENMRRSQDFDEAPPSLPQGSPRPKNSPLSFSTCWASTFLLLITAILAAEMGWPGRKQGR